MSPQPESILLYRYLPAEAAIKTIESHSFRVSRLLELNDPFEWSPGLESIQPEALDLARWCMARFLDELNEKMGIISFSSVVRDPILWSHYADAHRGVAIEVSCLIDESLHKVEYTNSRPVIPSRCIHDPVAHEKELLQILQKYFRQKSPSWSYENEYRAVASLASCRPCGGMFQLNIPDNFVTRVILGVRSSTSPTYVRRALQMNGFPNVQLVKATQNLRTYDIDLLAEP
jgi:hypothetical protein